MLAGLAVSLGTFSAIGILAIRESTDRVLQERLGNAQLVAKYTDSILLYAIRDLKDLALEEQITRPWEINRKLVLMTEDFNKLGFSIHKIFLLDSSGKPVWEQYLSAVISFSLPPYETIKKELADDHYISGSLESTNSLNAVVLLSVPVNLDGLNNTGVLGVVVDISSLGEGEFIQPLSMGKTGYTEIVDGTGVVLARTRPGQPPVASEISDHPDKFSQLIQQQKAVVRTCHRCHTGEEGTPRRRDIVAFAPVSVSSWGVALRQSEEEALGPVRQLQYRLLTFAGLLFLASFLLVRHLTSSVIKPIQSLTTASQKIAQGNLDGAISYESNDELGVLTDSFNQMRIKLRDSQQELGRWNRELEERVNKRTEEISYQLDIARMLGSTIELKPLLQGIMAALMELMPPVSSAHVLLYDSTKKDLVERACVGKDGETYAHLDSQVKEIAAEVHHSGLLQSCDYDDAEGHEKEMHPGGCLGAPLVVKNRTIGVFMLVTSSHPATFTPQDIRLIEATAQQIGLAIENARLHEETEEMAILQERDRMAREIHDGLAQTLAFINLEMGTVQELYATGKTERAMTELSKMVNATSEAYRQIRDTIVGLDTEAKIAQQISDTGFDPLLQQSLMQFTVVSGIHMEPFTGMERMEQLTLMAKVQIYRVVQESLNNIRKHSRATEAWIKAKVIREQLVLEIGDNGKGFDASIDFGKEHLGMSIMKRRVESLNGNLKIESSPGKGTRVLVDLPLKSVRLAV
ncbi:MAG: histidine kinase [Dehalococcoidia bacterium]|nr:histidine kinase [Dehalococcoidia bacterium]